MADRLIRNALIGGIFLLLLTPLIVANGFFFPFITGKNFFFRVLVEILVALWAILALRDARYRPTGSLLPIAIGVWIIVMAIANLLGENPFKSFWSNFERMEGFLMILHVAGYFLVAATVLQTERLWTWFWNTSIGVSVLVSIHALTQFLGHAEIHQGGVRVDASLGNAAYLAAYMLFHVFITVFLMLRLRGNVGVKLLYAAIAALQVFVLISTATRGAVLGLFAGVFLGALLLAIFERENRALRITAISSIVAVLVIVGGFLAIKNTEFVMSSPILSRFSNITLKEGETRLTIWGMAWQGFLEKPVLGWGQENFNLVFNKYYQTELYRQEPWFDHVHNIVLDWLIAGGLLGALAYFAIPLCALYYLWRKEGRAAFSVIERSVLTALLGAYFFQNLFVFDTVASYMLYMSVLAYIYVRSRKIAVKQKQQAPSTVAVPLELQRVGAVFAVVALAGGLYFINVRGANSAVALIDALLSTQNLPGSSAAVIEAFNKAGSHEVTGSQEVAEQATLLALQVASRSDVENEVKQKLYSIAKKEMNEELERAPEDSRLLLFYASLLSRFGQTEAAITALEKARAYSPGKPPILFELGNVYLQKGDTQKALAMFKDVYDRLPEYTDAKVNYAIAAIYAGDLALADSILKTQEQSGVDLLLHDSRLLDAFVATQRYDVVRAIWEGRLKENPQNASAHISLAAALNELGDTANAIEHLKMAGQLDPKFKAQSDAIIAQWQAQSGAATSSDN